MTTRRRIYKIHYFRGPFDPPLEPKEPKPLINPRRFKTAVGALQSPERTGKAERLFCALLAKSEPSARAPHIGARMRNRESRWEAIYG